MELKRGCLIPSGVTEDIRCLTWMLQTYLQSFTREASTRSREPSPSPVYLYIFIYTSVCLYTCVYTCVKMMYLQVPQRGHQTFGVGITSSCELLQVDGGNRTQALEEQHTPLTMEPSLQLLGQILK